MTTAKTPVAASLVAVLALTACSGGSSAVYDFTQESLTEPTSSIEFRVPDELIELEDGYAETRVYESITVSSVESDDPSECAVEMEFDFADDGLERYTENVESELQSGETLDDRMAARMTGRDLEHTEISEDYSAAVVTMNCAESPSEDRSTANVKFVHFVDGDTEVFAEAEVAVMKGGEVYVHEPDVEGWEADSNGDWIQ